MHDFSFSRPSDEVELGRHLSRTPGRILAGGTDLIVQLRHGSVDCPCLVDISGITELRFIRHEGDSLVIGALCTHADLEGSPLVRDWAPALAEAAASIGSRQTRERGTLGGNLVNASPAADTVAPLLVLDTEVVLAREGGSRIVPLDQFLLAPGRTCLEPGEYLARIRFRCLAGSWGTSFIKLGRRNAMAISVVNAAAFVSLAPSGRIQAARLAMGSVGPRVIRCRRAESMLVDRLPDSRLFQEAADAVQTDISPIDDGRSSAAYRRRAASVMAERALTVACDRARGK